MCTGAEPEAAAGAADAGAKGAGEVAATDAGAAASADAGAGAAAGAAAGAEGGGGALDALGLRGVGEPITAEEGAKLTAAFGGAAAVPSPMGDMGAAPSASTAATKSDVLGTIKTLAPAISAGASLIGAGAAYAQAQAVKNAPVPKAAGVDSAQQQKPLDPDLAEIRKRNALLFGLDSPSSTDLTKGSAATGSIGRATLLGG